MNPQPRRFLWYLGLIVLVLFIFKSPVVAAHFAVLSAQTLSAAAGALAKLASAL